MAFEDFARHFTHLDLVHVGPDDWMNEPALHSKKPWRAVLARRRWRGGYNAGGGTQHTGLSFYQSVRKGWHEKNEFSLFNSLKVLTMVPKTTESCILSFLVKKYLFTLYFLFSPSPLAGGDAETTAMNPQFHVQIPRAGLSKCHVVVSVTQQYDTFLSAQDTKRRHHLHPIGFAVYEIPPNMTRLTPAFVTENVRKHAHTHNL
uniref:Peptidase C2 calpain large subunit domain-containing protein n=1 Tax=Scylla olivacea TaxID=85551 RepID=A0A0P4WQE7_SCYOL